MEVDAAPVAAPVKTESEDLQGAIAAPASSIAATAGATTAAADAEPGPGTALAAGPAPAAAAAAVAAAAVAVGGTDMAAAAVYNSVDEANASMSGAAAAAAESGSLSPAGAARRKHVSGDVAIPKGSVKRVIKLDKDVRLVSAEAVLAISKATEFFLEHLSAKAHDCSRGDQDEPGTLKYRNVVSAQAGQSNCDFLNDLFKYWQPSTEQ